MSSTYTFAHRLRSGDKVRLRIDPKHEGRVVLATPLDVRVLWENGWRSDNQPSELEVVR